MDFGALPPEVNSGRMYLGPGPATLLTASAEWEGLAAELHTTVGGYQSVISALTDESWIGRSSMSMVAAVAPHLLWMRLTAAQCEEAAGRATAAASAFETAFAMTVPPSMIAANRVRLMTLIATNPLAQNTPAIMATEAEYSEMWALDATAMYGYAAGSASASDFSTFASPPRTTDPGGPTDQAGAVAQMGATRAGGTARSMSARLISSVPQALQGLSNPGSSAGTGTVEGLASSSASAPSSALSGLAMSGLGTDVRGLDFGGIGSDVFGTDVDMAGADSVSGMTGGVSGMDGETVAGLGQCDAMGTLSVPPSWADALSVPPPEPVLDANVMPGGWGAVPSPTAARPIAKLPSGGMVGRESAALFQRLGFRGTVIPHSPVAG
jgi:PPE-repeat protein